MAKRKTKSKTPKNSKDWEGFIEFLKMVITTDPKTGKSNIPVSKK